MKAALRHAALATAVLAAAAVLGGARPAAAEVRRYAFLVGANRGHAHETPLRYAESDVDAVARTLSDLGGFAPERVLRLNGATAARVRGALVDFNLRIQEEVRAGHEAVLFVYYSGHADGQSLHLGPTDLPSEEFSKLVRLSPAKLKLLLLDACRSGAVTRVKGGRQVAPFQIGVHDQLRSEGYAVISSSAAGEDAQESDELRSSIFTHHFLTALRGPGDLNRDRQVTLGEAYGYAAEQALKASMATIVGTQHATYDYDLRGRVDPVLTDLRQAGDLGQLVFASAGDYLVISADSSAVLLETSVKGPRGFVLLPAGPYKVRLRTRTNVYQGELALRPGAAATVGAGELRPMPLAQVVRKGETEARLAQGPSVGGLVHGPLGAGFSPMLGAQLGYSLELPRLTLVPRLALSSGGSEARVADVSRHRLLETAVDLAALYVIDLGPVSVAPLLSVGAAFLRQSIERSCVGAPECAITRRPVGLASTAGAWAFLPLGRGFVLEAATELATFLFKRQQHTQATGGETIPSVRTATLTYRAFVGLGYRY